jgi:hypothetical protein
MPLLNRREFLAFVRCQHTIEMGLGRCADEQRLALAGG